MMSDITISRLEVVNGHTDIICSTSVSHILAVRKTTLLQIDTLIRQLTEISAMTESIGGKTALDWAMKQDFSWNYKTNCPCKFGNKIIVNNLVRWDRWGLHLITGQQADRLADLERMLHLFSGKPIPDNRENITIHLDEHIRSLQGKECYEDEMFIIKYFKKGSAHITFRKPELVDRLNDIIAKHYPDMLAV